MIIVNEQEIDYKIGMTVADAIVKAGETLDIMTLVMVDGEVLPYNRLNSELLVDGMNIKFLPILSGG